MTPPPKDSPDLALLMSFVTSVGGLSAWTMRRSVPGAAAGLGLGTLFLYGGLHIMESSLLGQRSKQEFQATSSHEVGHQTCLIGSLMFSGAMSYRAGSNPYTGPGGAMLAALGAVSALYHLDKMVEWRAWEDARIQEAEKLLQQQWSGQHNDGHGEVINSTHSR